MFINTCILCPGQGAQAIGMGRDFFEASAAARLTFETAGRIVGFDLARLCFQGPEERLNQTDISQPAIYTTSVACHRAAVAAGLIRPGEAAVFAGLSLGEYTALHLAGVFSFEDGLRLVAARGRYMQESAVASPSGMVALMGADEAAAIQLCEENARGQVLVPANYNSPGQIVVSGAMEACGRMVQAAEARGFKAIPLKVAGAFHSPLMQPAADRMQAELDKVSFAAPQATVYANVTAQPHAGPDQIKALLVRQIIRPVRWEQTMQALISAGGLRFVELAPGRTLTGLAKKINRRLPMENLATAEALLSLQPASGSPPVATGN
jgi:[acyl-carrier-protein] S-malonyltransferase